MLNAREWVEGETSEECMRDNGPNNGAFFPQECKVFNDIWTGEDVLIPLLCRAERGERWEGRGCPNRREVSKRSWA